MGANEKLATGASNVNPPTNANPTTEGPEADVPTRLLTVTGMLRIPVPGALAQKTVDAEVHAVVIHPVSVPIWAVGDSLLPPKFKPEMVTELYDVAARLNGARYDTSGASYVKTIE